MARGVEDQYDVNPKVIATYAGGAVALGLAITLFHQGSTVGALCSLSALMVGVVAGLLFGVPKGAQLKAEDYGQKENTNLEEISDWLTKIIVGLGIAQFPKIHQTLNAAAGYVGQEMGSGNNGAFASSIILYFGLVGFITGYLLTRIFLPRMFYKARPVIAPSVKRLADQLGEVASGTPKEVANKLILRTSQLLEAYHDLERKANPDVLQKHLALLTTAKAGMPNSRLLFIALGRLFRATGNLNSAIDVLSEFINNKPDTNYDTATALFNRACYSTLKAIETNPPDSNLLYEALEDLRRSIELVPEFKNDLETDPDLSILRNAFRPEIEKLTTR